MTLREVTERPEVLAFTSNRGSASEVAPNGLPFRNDVPVLLCDAGYCGTLAAVRSLGRQGVRVVLADSSRRGPAFWSRYTSRGVHSPRGVRPEHWVEWLLAFGQRNGRHVLCPTSDEIVFLQAAYKGELSQRFAMHQPDFETILKVLDKKRLWEIAGSCGFDTPETWFPEDPGDVERIARHAGGPVLIKPRTQAFLKNHLKGALVADLSRLREEYDRFCRENEYAPPIAGRMPELTRPMIQRYYADAPRWIYSLTGFRDRTGRHLPLLGAVKVLQVPRRMGVGLCFESATVLPELVEPTRWLLERLAYYGIFELEFVRDGDRLLLIDMNPRLYNQVAFDIARGLDLPRLAYASAVGDERAVEHLVARLRQDETDHVLCNRMGMRLLLGAQRLFGTMSAEEANEWSAWVKRRERIVVDAVGAREDPVPSLLDAASHIYGCVRHPRAFWRLIALGN